MAQFLRGKQTGVQTDISHGIEPAYFMLDDLERYGVNSQIAALAYEPLQSLLAVGTRESQFGPGKIYVYGQKRVCVTFILPRASSIKEIQFCGEKLIVLDSKFDISVFSLDARKQVANYTPPGHATAMVTDASLDYSLTGLQNGEVVAYDLDRDAMTPFKIPNLWRDVNPRTRLAPVVCMQFHPKDIGTLLIGYPEGAAIYSFKQNKAIKHFQYEIPRGAPGGDANPIGSRQSRFPKLTHAIWHPTGTFVMTAHDDSSLVFWDPRDGRLLEARTIEDSGVNLPSGGAAGPPCNREPYTRIAWCSKENPDDTGILLGGGTPTLSPTSGLTFIDLGPTPNYQTSSWDVLTRHFRNPKRIHILPTPPNTYVTNFIPIPRNSPHYAGSHDPIAVIAILSSGEMVTLSFPTGHPITPTNQLHVSLSFVHPFVTKVAVSKFDRVRWLGTQELRDHGPRFLLGGAEETKPMKRFEERNIVQTAHADGTIRLWDVGVGDEIENPAMLQVDVPRALGRWDDIVITEMSMSGSSGELSIGLRSGEILVFRLNRNQLARRPPPPSEPNEGPGKMTDISKRADPELREGMLPLTLANDQQGPVTAIKNSDVGFVAAGYESGGICIIDLRGPAIIHTALLQDLTARKSSTIKGKRTSQTHQHEFATVIDFGVMTLEGDDYSSIALFVGTNRGRVITFKILPSQSGRYSGQFAGAIQLADDRVISLSPIHADTGKPASATGEAVAGLHSGRKVNGVLVAVTTTSAHIFRPASAKGASKTFDSFTCYAAAVARFELKGCALVGIFGDGQTRAFSIPALKEIASARASHILDVKRFADACITSTGDILGWCGPSEMALLSVWGAGQPLRESEDRLYDPLKVPTPRPTISNLQWIAGTQYITPSDMDVLIGGPGRPPSKRMLAEMRAQQDAEYQRQREVARTGRATPPVQNQEGYWAYMQRQIQERTENLGLASDSMERTAESSNSFSNDVSNYIKKQKRQAALGFVSSKFGF